MDSNNDFEKIIEKIIREVTKDLAKDLSKQTTDTVKAEIRTHMAHNYSLFSQEYLKYSLKTELKQELYADLQNDLKYQIRRELEVYSTDTTPKEVQEAVLDYFDTFNISKEPVQAMGAAGTVYNFETVDTLISNLQRVCIFFNLGSQMLLDDPEFVLLNMVPDGDEDDELKEKMEYANALYDSVNEAIDKLNEFKEKMW